MIRSRYSFVAAAFAILSAVYSHGLSSAQDRPPAAGPGSEAAKAAAEEVIKKGEVLTLERCIAAALQRQPNIIAAMNTIEVNRSRIGQAKANYYPQVSLSSGYSRISPVGAGSSRSSEGGNGSAFDQYTASALLSQNIYDFGKTAAQVKIQQLNTNASRSDLETTTEQIVFNVKQAYYTLLQAVRNRNVSEEAVKQFEKHLEQAKGFYDVGTKPKFDVTKAEVDLSNAKLNLIKAENAISLAKVNLNNAMGVPNAPEFSIEDNLAFRKHDLTFSDAIARAFANRPDIQATATRRKAAEENIALARKNYYPALTGNAAYSYSGTKFPLEDGWNVGATLTFPLFSGFLTKYQVEEAKSNLNVLTANEELTKQNAVLDVQQAYLSLREAEDRIATADLTVRQSTENLDIANGRYAAGVGSPIEVTDAQVTYSNAKLAYIQALSDYNIAWASLARAMGER